jgi:hypothetical protein
MKLSCCGKAPHALTFLVVSQKQGKSARKNAGGHTLQIFTKKVATQQHFGYTIGNLCYKHAACARNPIPLPEFSD